MFRRLGQLSNKKLQKVSYFAKKHEKLSIWANCGTFSSKPPCLIGWVTFSGKSCKKCLISRESMKNRRFGQNVHLFGTNCHVSTFWSTFQQKVGKGASFREKASKLVDFAKTCNFLEQTTMSRRLGEVFSKRLQKVPNFATKHEKSSIWPELATFMSKPPRVRV